MNATFILHKEKYLDAALTHRLQFFFISFKFYKMISKNYRQKSWNTCVRFPLPKFDLGVTVISVLQNTRGSTLGRERAHYSETKSVRSKSQQFSWKFKKSEVRFNDLWRVLKLLSWILLSFNFYQLFFISKRNIKNRIKSSVSSLEILWDGLYRTEHKVRHSSVD